jgi:hypothetical protein
MFDQITFSDQFAVLLGVGENHFNSLKERGLPSASAATSGPTIREYHRIAGVARGHCNRNIKRWISILLEDDIMSETICATCHTPFTPRRSTARYCGSACRVAAHRLSVTEPDGPSTHSPPAENRTTGLPTENGLSKSLAGLKKISVTSGVSNAIEHRIGVTDWPINLLGGYRAPNAPRLERDVRERLLHAEVCA